MQKLSNNLPRSQTTLELLLSGVTKLAGHIAAHFRRQTQGQTIVRRNQNGLHQLGVSHIEKIFSGAIGTDALSDHLWKGQIQKLGHLPLKNFRQIGHLTEIRDPLTIDPAKELLGAELLFAPADQSLFQFLQIEIVK